jgi:hypothetical protein
MELKEILGKYIDDNEKLENVIGELTQDLAKGFIPKNRFNEVNEELKTTRSQLNENKTAMEGLTKKANSVEEYETRLAELQTKNTEIEEKANKQISSITKKTQLKELLLLNNAHKDAIELLVDKYSDIAEVTDGKLIEPDKLLETIKKEKAGLFIETKNDSDDKGSHKDAETTKDDNERLRKLFNLK